MVGASVSKVAVANLAHDRAKSMSMTHVLSLAWVVVYETGSGVARDHDPYETRRLVSPIRMASAPTNGAVIITFTFFAGMHAAAFPVA